MSETNTTLSPQEVYNQLSSVTPPTPLFPDATPPNTSNLSTKEQNLCKNAYNNYENVLKKATKQFNEQADSIGGFNTLQASMQSILNTSLNCVSNNIFSQIQENVNDEQAIIFNIKDSSAKNLKLCSTQSINQKNAVVNYTSSKVENSVINTIKNTQNEVQKISNSYFKNNPNLNGTPAQKAIQYINNSSVNLNYNNIYKNSISTNLQAQGNVINIINVPIKGTINLCKNNQNIIQNISITNIVNSFVQNIFKNNFNNNQSLKFTLEGDSESLIISFICYIIVLILIFSLSFFYLEKYKETLASNNLSKHNSNISILIFIFGIAFGLSSWALNHYLSSDYFMLAVISSGVVGFFFILYIYISNSPQLKKIIIKNKKL